MKGKRGFLEQFFPFSPHFANLFLCLAHCLHHPSSRALEESVLSVKARIFIYLLLFFIFSCHVTHPPELSVVCPIFSGALWQFSWTMCWSRIFASTWSGAMLTTCIAYLHCMWIYSISFIDLKGFLGYYYIIYRKNVENVINNSEMLHSGWKSHF